MKVFLPHIVESMWKSDRKDLPTQRHNSETEERNISENLKATIASNYVRISILIYIIIVVVVIVIRRTLQLVILFAQTVEKRRFAVFYCSSVCVCVCFCDRLFLFSHENNDKTTLCQKNKYVLENELSATFVSLIPWVSANNSNQYTMHCCPPTSFNHICPSPPHISTNTHKRTVCSSKTTSNGKLCPREVCSSANYVERNNLHRRTWKKQRYTPPIVRWSPTTNTHTHKPAAATTTTRTKEKTFPFVVVLHLNFPSRRLLLSDSVSILDVFSLKK